jgi:hypothetical protein
MSGAQPGRAEFPVPVDNAAFYIPTVGIAMMGATGAAIIAFPLGMMGVPGWIVLPGIVAAAIAAGLWWVRRVRRVHAERKLVLEREGITYYRFADRPYLIRWTDIVSIVEHVDRGDETLRWLEFKLQGGGAFRIYSDAFIGFEEIRDGIVKMGSVPISR